MNSTYVIIIGIFLAILIIISLVRAVMYKKFEVLAIDIVVAVMPAFMYLLLPLSGKIHDFEIVWYQFKVAIKEASASDIALQVTRVTSFPIVTDLKGNINEIPKLIQSKTQGLVFRLGSNAYYGQAIQEYLVRLTQQPFLQYVIIENPDKTFFAMADAKAMARAISVPPYLMQNISFDRSYTEDQLATWLNSSDKESLKKLPGFISAENAVIETIDKDQALQRMESLNIDHLPVVNKDKDFVGIVYQSRLTASLILDVVKALKK